MCIIDRRGKTRLCFYYLKMKILTIEDDQNINAFVKKGLQAEGFLVDIAKNGHDGLKAARENNYDLIILDLYLPDINGWSIAKSIREKNNTTPIIVLTAEMQMETKVRMLKQCDDYITKPFSIQELVARVKAVLRRGKMIYGDILEIGDLKMDIKAHKVYRAEKEISLRNKEFALLECLMRHPGMVLSRGVLLEKVWGMGSDPFTNTIDVHIRFLRQKIETDYNKKIIRTVPTQGYKLEI